MRKVMLASALAALVTGSAFGGLVQGVIPSEYENAGGPGAFLYFSGARGYQFIIHESELTDFVGLRLTGLTWRANTTAYPASDVLIDNFEIRLSEGVAPADRSTNFASNIVGAQTLVRTGPLSIPTGAYPGGQDPNEWGLKIGFDDYQYDGGHLVIEIRHTGAPSGTLDATTTSTEGYGTRYAAVWGSGFDTQGSFNANFIIMRLNAIPAPGALAVLGAGLVAVRRRRRD